MRLVKNVFVLLFCITLFCSCSVDELEDDSQLNLTEDVVATGEEEVTVDNDKDD